MVTTDPTLVDATIVYGNTYCIHNGAYIGGCISQGAFSEDEPDAEQKTAAIDGYNSHIAMMKERFVHYLVEFGKVDAILSMAKPERVPTLEERAANKKIWDELEKRSPVTLDEARDILNKG